MTGGVNCLSRVRDESFQVVIPMMMMWKTPEILNVQGRAVHINWGIYSPLDTAVHLRQFL